MKTLISSISYFSDLSEESLSIIEQAAVRKTYQPQQVIVLEGEPAAGLYIVESGWLKVVKYSTAGREQVLNFLRPGDTFNAVAVFSGAENQATVVALEEAVVWIIRRSVMLDLLDSHPRLAQSIIQDLAGRLQHLIGLVEDLSLRSIESRLARSLLEGASDTTLNRQKWATQTEMAARLGTVPDVLNRALRKLVEEGLIEMDRHQIRILDPEGLLSRIDPD